MIRDKWKSIITIYNIFYTLRPPKEGVAEPKKKAEIVMPAKAGIQN